MLVLVAASDSIAGAVSAQSVSTLPCSLCRDRSAVQVPDTIPVDSGILAGQTCEQLDFTVGLMFNNASSNECRAVRSLGSLCGCPLPVKNGCASLCPDGSLPTRPNNDLPFLHEYTMGIPSTCSTIDAYLRSSEEADMDVALCEMSQHFFGDYCGCNDSDNENGETSKTESDNEEGVAGDAPPIDETMDEEWEACSLCPNGGTVLEPDKAVGSLPAGMGPVNITISFLETCGSMESFVNVVVDGRSPRCTAIQTLASHCECPSSTGDGGDGQNDTGDGAQGENGGSQNTNENPNGQQGGNEENGDSDSSTNAENEAPIKETPSACMLCTDGSKVPDTTKQLEFLTDSFGGITPTCGVVETLLLGYDSSSELCSQVQLAGSLCGCPPIENHCQYCDDLVLKPEFAERPVELFEDFFGIPGFTCAEAWVTQYQVEDGSELCGFGRGGSSLCGCENGHLRYFEAKTTTQQAVLAWMPRFSAFLSMVVSSLRSATTSSSRNCSFPHGSLSLVLTRLLTKRCEYGMALLSFRVRYDISYLHKGSALIMFDTFSNPLKRRKVYNRLVVGVSIADMVASFGWFLSTWPIPEDDGLLSFEIYGARGNDTTCKIQGFMLTFVATAYYCNLALAMYYYLVIVRNWTETRLRRIHGALIGVAYVVGTASAFAAIPYYGNVDMACSIQVPPTAPSWYPIMVFLVGPTILVMVVGTALIGAVYLKVRRQVKQGLQWSFPVTTPSSSVGSGTVSQEHSGFQPTSSSGLDQSSGPTTHVSTPRPGQRPTLASSTLLQGVYWQSFWYMVAFCSTHFMLMCMTIILLLQHEANVHLSTTYSFWLTIVVVTPLQGLWNALVYFRPRIIRVLAKRAEARKQQRREEQQRLQREQECEEQEKQDNEQAVHQDQEMWGQQNPLRKCSKYPEGQAQTGGVLAGETSDDSD